MLLLDLLVGLITNILFLLVFVNLCKIKFNWVQIIVIVLSLTIVNIAWFQLIDMASNLAALLGNIATAIVFSIAAYRKIKVVPLSVLYGAFTSIMGLLAGNLSGAILGFALMPILGAVNAVIVQSNAFLGALYIALSFALAYLISRKSGNYLHKEIGNMDEALKTRLANYILVGAAIIFALFLINNFLHEILIAYAILTLVNAVSLSILFCFLAFTIFTFTSSVRKESEIRYKNEMLQNLQSYNTTVEDMATEMRRFRHDHMNMLLGFNEYVENNDNENIKTYFRRYMVTFNEATTAMESQMDTLKNIKVPEIKSILSAKLLYAQQLGIAVNIEVPDEIVNIEMSSLLDFCRITGIFLDNAIDACRGVDGAVIRFMAIKKADEVLFVFVNTCDILPNMARLGSKGYTTKEGQRGLGLYSARQLIEANKNLVLSTLVEDGTFIQELSVLMKG